MDQNQIEYYRNLAAQNPDKKDLIFGGAAFYHSSGANNKNLDLDTVIQYGKRYRSLQPPEIVKGFKSGIDDTQAAAYGAVGLAGSAVGSDKIRDWGYEGYQRNKLEAEENAPRVQDIRDVDSVGSAADWAMGTLGTLGPSIIESIGAALAGGGITGLAARKVGREYIEKSITKEVAKAIEKGLVKEEAEKFAKNAVLGKIKDYGQKAGITLGVGATEGGSMFGDAADRVGVENVNPYVTGALGLLSGASEIMGPEGHLARDIVGGKVIDTAKKLTRREALKELPLEMLKEGGQEVLQQGLQDVSKLYHDPKATVEPLDYINSFAGGVLGGLAFGTPGLAFGRSTPKNVPTADIIESVKNTVVPDSTVEQSVAGMMRGLRTIDINQPGISSDEIAGYPERFGTPSPAETSAEVFNQDLVRGDRLRQSSIGLDLLNQDLAERERLNPVVEPGVGVDGQGLARTGMDVGAGSYEVPAVGPVINSESIGFDPSAPAPWDELVNSSPVPPTTPSYTVPEGVKLASSGNPFSKGVAERAAANHTKATGEAAEAVQLGGRAWGWRVVPKGPDVTDRSVSVDMKNPNVSGLAPSVDMGSPVVVHETPVGETQPNLMLTDEPQTNVNPKNNTPSASVSSAPKGVTSSGKVDGRVSNIDTRIDGLQKRLKREQSRLKRYINVKDDVNGSRANVQAAVDKTMENIAGLQRRRERLTGKSVSGKIINIDSAVHGQDVTVQPSKEKSGEDISNMLQDVADLREEHGQALMDKGLREHFQNSLEKGRITPEKFKELETKGVIPSEASYQKGVEAQKKIDGLRYATDKTEPPVTPDHGPDVTMNPVDVQTEDPLSYNLPKNTIAGGVNEIADLHDKVRSGEIKGEKRAVRYQHVNADEAARLKENTGLNLQGYKHTIDNYGIEHSYKEHGDQNGEANRGQLAITKDDFNKIPEIINSYDDVKLIGKTPIGQDLIQYKKRFNGTTYFVEEVRNKRQELSVKTMWKTRSASDAPTPGSESPSLRPKPFVRKLPHDQIISDPDSLVNSKAEPVKTRVGNVTLADFERESQPLNPWDVTRQNWVDIQRAERRRLGQSETDGTKQSPYSSYEGYHEQSVKDAIKRGEHVHSDVLADYPDFKAAGNESTGTKSIEMIPKTEKTESKKADQPRVETVAEPVQDVITDNGNPYNTKGDAVLAIQKVKAMDTHDPVRVDGGWVGQQREVPEIGKSAYDMKREARADRYGELAEKAQVRSDAAFQRSQKIGERFYMGQPILAGHHSEKGARAAQKRMWNASDKSVEESKKADHYRQKASAAESNTAISSDDSNATVKLQEKIRKAEFHQETMKAINKIVKSKKLTDQEKIDNIVKSTGFKEELAKKLIEPDFAGRKGFPDYELQNNNANIRRMKGRLSLLEKQSTGETSEHEFDGGKIVDNVEANRVQIHFDGMPDGETKKKLRANGFKWSPTEKAWQRKRSSYAMDIAKEITGAEGELNSGVVDKLEPENDIPIESSGKASLTDSPKFSIKNDASENHEFIPNSHGDIDYGHINEDVSRKIRRQSAPIRLEVGDASYGKRHIELRHGAQIAGEGYKNVEDFVEEITNGFDEIYQGRAGTLILRKKNGKDKIAYVVLSPSESGDFYTVKSATFAQSRYLKKKELLWSGAHYPNSEKGTLNALDSGQSNDKLSHQVNQDVNGKNSASLDELKDGQRQTADKLIQSGRMNISTEAEALKALESGATGKYDNNGKIQGFVLSDGVAHIIPENIPAGQIWGVMRHEIGVHVGRLLQDNPGFESLKRAIEKRMNENSSFGEAIRKAFDRVPEDTKPEHRAEEALAYLVESAPKAGLIRRLIAMVKHALTKMGVDHSILNEKDIAALADAALRREAENPVKNGIKETPQFSEIDGAVPFLTGKPVVELTGEEFKKTDIPIVEHVADWFEKNDHGVVSNPRIGDVTINRRGIKDSISHGLGRKKAAAFAAVPDIIKSGVVIDRQENYKDKGHGRYILAAPVLIGGDHHIGVVVVIGDKSTNRFYLHEVGLTEKLRQSSKTAASAKMGELHGTDDAVSIKNIVQKALFVNENSEPGSDPGQPLFSISGHIDDALDFAKTVWGRKGDAVTVAKGIWNDRNLTHPKDKKDVTWLEKSFGLVSYYSKKIPAFKRAFEHALKNGDIKTMIQQVLTHGKDEKGQTEKYIETVADFRKKDRAAYETLSRYLDDRDVNQIGYKVKDLGEDTAEGRYEVYNPQGKTTGYTFNTEKEAWDKTIILEAEDYVKAGNSEESARALTRIRIMNNNMYDLRISKLNEIIEYCDRNGIKMPQITHYENGKEVQIDLKLALAKMGDHRGYYMPRQRDNGGWAIYASKKGTHSILKFSDLRLVALGKKALLEKQGYTVEVKQAPKMSEDLFEQLGSVLAQQTAMNESLRKIERGDKVMKMKDLDLDGEWEGSTFVVKGDGLSPEYKDALESLGGVFKQRHKMMKGGELFWSEYRFENAGKDIEEKVTNTVFKARGIAPDIAVQFAQAMVSQYADIIRSRGSRSAMIGRSEATGIKVTKGYEEDALTRVTRAAYSLAGGEAKSRTALNMIKAISGTDVSWSQFSEIQQFGGTFEDYEKQILDSGSEYVTRETFDDVKGWGSEPNYDAYTLFVKDRGIDPGRQKNAHSDAMALFKDMMRNQDKADRVIGTLKGLAVLKYLGFRYVSAPLVNMTNMWVGVPAAMMGYGKIPLWRALKLIVSSYQDYYKFKKGALGNEEMTRVFQEIEKRGWDKSQFNQEGMSVLKNQMQYGYAKMLETSMMMFSWSEKMNRVATITAAFKGLSESKPGLTFEERLKLAHEISNKAHGIYEKANRPAAMRGSGIGANALQMAYVFKTFAHNFLATMADLAIREKDAKAIAWMAFSPVVFGAGSSIGASLLIKAIGMALGSDQPEEEFYRAVEANFGSYAGDFSRYGIFQAFGHGFSVKGSLAVGLGDVPTSFKDLVGAPGAVIGDILDGIKETGRGNVMKGVEKMMPLAVSSPIKAYREVTEGVTTKSNAPVFFEGQPLKADGIDAFFRALSFNPVRIAKAHEMNYADREKTAVFAERRQDIYQRLRRYYVSGNTNLKDLEQVEIEIAAYNQRAKRDGETLITGKTIKSVLKRSKLE